jgi:hypothetical protein
VQSPAGDFINIRPAHRLFVADHFVQTRLGKFSYPVALVVFKLGESLQESYLELNAGEPLHGVINHAPSVEKRVGTGHRLLSSAVPNDIIAIEQIGNCAIGALKFVAAGDAKQSHQNLTKNGIIIDCEYDPEIAPNSQMVERRMKPILQTNRIRSCKNLRLSVRNRS